MTARLRKAVLDVASARSAVEGRLRPTESGGGALVAKAASIGEVHGLVHSGFRA